MCSWAQFTFTTNNGAITITSYNGYDAHVEIPDTTNGYPVTAIGEYAFFGGFFLTEVLIPSSITNISGTAFNYCLYLTNIEVNANNPNFASTNGVLFDKSFTTLLQFPSGLAGGYTISGSVTNIGDYAFASCFGLTGVVIPNNVVRIGDAAFFNCSGLTNILIPPSATNIGEAVLGYCPSLTNIQVDAANPNYISVNGVLFDKAMSTLLAYPGGLTGDYVIPGSVASIAVDGFAGCSGLSTVTIGNNVTSIGGASFVDCSNLTDIVIPDSITNIGEFAFYHCLGLTNIEVGTSNPSYTNAGGVLFDKAMTTLIQYPGGRFGECLIPESVSSISNGAFSASRVTRVSIPNNVTSIDQSTFAGCFELNSITIPNSVTNIGNFAFASCYSLTDIRIPDSVSSLGEGVFSECSGLTNIAVGKNVMDIKNYAFLYCSSLKSVALPNSLRSIGDEAFDFCTNLTSITIPDNVTTVGDDAFAYCAALTNVLIGNSVTNIGDSAFRECRSLKVLKLGTGVINIGQLAFCACIQLTSVTIPDSVLSIGDLSFYSCSQLTSVTIPDNVRSIGDGAFLFCTNLTNVVIGANVASIGISAFGSCASLHQAYFLGNAPSVDGGAGSTNNSVFFSGYIAMGTVYYVPGTTGWEASFGGWPTAGWYQPQPQILGSGYGLGVQSNQFTLTISWATNTPVVVEASTNLQNWSPVITNSLVNGTNVFSDSAYTNYPQRFYRVRSQ